MKVKAAIKVAGFQSAIILSTLAIATLIAIVFGAGNAQASTCRYVTVDGKSAYVCDTRAAGSRCGYVYVNGKSTYICS